jgi:hypothetical protein
MVFEHEQLFEQSGLHHGTGAICCGCPVCHVLSVILRNIMNGSIREKGGDKISMNDDRLMNSFSDGLMQVKTYITPASKVYYVVHINYYVNSGIWKNQTFTMLDGEVTTLMSLLRRALLFSKKSYVQLNNQQ